MPKKTTTTSPWRGRARLTRATAARVRSLCADSAFSRYYVRRLLAALARHSGRAAVTIDDVLTGRVGTDVRVGFRNPDPHYVAGVGEGAPLGAWYDDAEDYLRAYFLGGCPRSRSDWEHDMELRVVDRDYVDDAAAPWLDDQH
jgi:hypothetical protein